MGRMHWSSPANRGRKSDQRTAKVVGQDRPPAARVPTNVIVKPLKSAPMKRIKE